MKIIVGLGNPGERYAATRHNLGFMVVDALAVKGRASLDTKAHRSLTGRARLAGMQTLLVKPQTFMNLSGEAVGAIFKSEGIAPSDLIVIHDDLDLGLGWLRVRKSGGDGGHNGIKSIIEHLDTGAFVRVKLGVGRPEDRQDPADYVLSAFREDEMGVVTEVVGRAVDAVMSILREGPDRAMNRFNKPPDLGVAPETSCP